MEKTKNKALPKKVAKVIVKVLKDDKISTKEKLEQIEEFVESYFDKKN